MANHILLETIHLTQDAASVTFDNIPQTGYTDLKIVMSARTNRSAYNDYLKIGFNGGTTGITYISLEGNSSAASSFGTSAAAQFIGEVNGNTSTANTFSSFDLYITDYTSSNNKSYSIDSVTENNFSTTNSAFANLTAGLWSSASAITSLTISPGVGSSILQYSTFSLYGVAATGTTPAVAPKATGGNIVTNDGTYWYHAFLSSGTFTPQTSLTCDLLIVAGGGGGGVNNGGGGGAGGVVALTNESLSHNSTYAVMVGAGGVGSYGNDYKGGNGTNSQVASLTAAVGGGGGGSYFNVNGANGGSGGGGGGNADGTGSGTGGTPTSGQGNAGGNGQTASNPNHRGGGGGGAGAAGTSGTSTQAPHGGVGVSTYSAWGAATLTGQNSGGTYYYAGGGGGARSNTSGGDGGLGGGGNGGGSTAQTDGTANTGGGGGAQPNQGSGSTSAGKAGGSGIVIIRYAM